MASSAIGIPWKTHISAGDETFRIDSRDSPRFDSTRENADSDADSNADSIGLRVDRRREGRAEGRGGIVRNICGIGWVLPMRQYLKPAGDILYINKLTAKIGMTR